MNSTRRKYLKTGGTGLIFSTLGVGSVNGQETSQSSQPDISWTPFTGRYEIEYRDSQPAIHASNMTGEVRNVDLSAVQFEIERVDTNKAIQFEFQDNSEVVNSAFGFRIYSAAGEIRDQPIGYFYTGDGRNEYELTMLGGDRDIFTSGDVFGNYIVHIIQNGDRVSSTQEKFYGIGYATDYQEQIINGAIEVSISAIENITSSWQITYVIENQTRIDRGYDVEELHRSEMELDDNQLVTSFDPDKLKSEPENGIQVRWIRFTPPGEAEKFLEDYQIESSTRNTSLSIGGHSFEDELLYPGDAPVSPGGFTTFFRSPSQAPGITGTITGGGLIGGGYLLYKWRSSDDKSQSQDDEPSHQGHEPRGGESTTNSSDPADLTYTDIETGDVVTETIDYDIHTGEIPTHNLSTWVITPSGSTGDTIDTATTEAFVETVDQWANVDSHEYLTSVYGHGTDPLPWLATEPADGKPLGAEFSIADRINIFTHVCEGVHHVSRYGVVYENLTPESIRVDQNETLQLRGVIDEFLTTDASRYQPPEDAADSTHDAADVYRVGAVAYEILTGEQPTTQDKLAEPSTVNQNLPAEIDSILLRAMADTPEDRFETVLHLRDALNKV